MRKVAIITGVSMLGLAWAVVSQAGLIDSLPSLQGNMFGGSSSSGASDMEVCEKKIVDGIIQECCKTPYSVYYTCRHYSDTFEDLCKEAGLEGCKKISIYCGGDTRHAINEVTIGNERCLVEPQGRVVDCIALNADSGGYDTSSMCSTLGVPSPCECTVTDYVPPDDIPSDFTNCAIEQRVGDPVAKCHDCCLERVLYHRKRGDPLAEKWLEQCRQACDATDGEVECPTVVIGTVIQKKCLRSFEGTCNTWSCLQPFNTGKCNADGECIVLDRTCEASGLVCENPSKENECPTEKQCSEGYLANECDAVTCLQPYNTGKCNEDTSCIVEERRCENEERDCEEYKTYWRNCETGTCDVTTEKEKNSLPPSQIYPSKEACEEKIKFCYGDLSVDCSQLDSASRGCVQGERAPGKMHTYSECDAAVKAQCPASSSSTPTSTSTTSSVGTTSSSMTTSSSTVSATSSSSMYQPPAYPNPYGGYSSSR